MSQLWRAIGTDALAIVNATSGNETVPLTRMAAGRNVTVRRVDSSAYTVTVTVTSGLSLDGVLNGTTTVAVNSEKQFLAVDGGFESFGGPTPGSIGSVELADGSVAAVDLAAGVAPTLAADTAFTGTYGRLRSQRSMPRLKSLPSLMSSPPTITFTGASNPASSIASAQFLSAVDVPYPGTPTALSSTFTYGYGIVQRDNTYYGLPYHNGGVNSLPYRVAGWFYGQKIEFAYRGTGNLVSRLSVNGDYAEAPYTADTTLNGAPHVRAFDFGTAAWRFLEFECSAAFYGIYMGPTDTWRAAKVPAERLLVIGDSYGQGTGATAPFSAYPFTLGRLLGFGDVYSYSLGSTGLLATPGGGSPTYRGRSSQWAATGATAVFIQHSINDDGSSTSALNAEMELLVPAVRAALPNAEIWIGGPAARGGGDVATKQTRDAALAAHAASLGIPYASLVNPTALWSGSGRVGALTGTGNSDIMMGSDNAHPTQAGHDMIAQAWAAGIVSQRAAA